MKKIIFPTLLLCFFLSSAGTAEDLKNVTNIHFVRELYANVNNTIPSVVNAKEHTEVIKQRLECYEKNHEYTQRIRICNNQYLKEIVQLARTAVHSRPSLGEFVLNVSACPIVYNLCVGKTKNDQERCQLFERQCIDYTLDTYWRGSAQYTQQTFRSE